MTEAYILSHPFIFAVMLMVAIVGLFAVGVGFGRLLVEVEYRYGILPAYVLFAAGIYAILLGATSFVSTVTT